MAPKRPARAALGSVVRTTRRIVRETVDVTVVEEKDAAPSRKKVVEVEVHKKTGEPPTALLAPAVKGEGEVAAPQPPTPRPPVREKQPPARGKEEESEEEIQPPLESEEPERGEEKPQVEGEGRGEEERQQGVAPNGGLKRERHAGKKGKAAEGQKGKGEEKGKKRRRRRRRSGGEAGGAGGGRGYKTYVFRVLKQVHPELGVSSMAMTVLDSLMKDMFERIVDEATRLSKYSGKATLSSREIQGAVRLLLPGELGKLAVAEGTRAVANYMAAEKASV